MKLPIHIALIENRRSAKAATVRKQVEDFLKNYPCTVSCYTDAKEMDKADVAIVLGGDGTMLRTADCLAPKKIPLLGINLGRVGYLAELDVDEIPLLARLFQKAWHIESRMMLDVTLRTKEGENSFLSVNDAVIGNFGASRLVEIGARHNGHDIGAYLADGLIVSTPTGSTAYSMSAGGSVLDPMLDCISLTPICPISPYAKPLIFSALSTLEFKNCTTEDAQLYLTVDGHNVGTLYQNDKVIIRKSDCTVRFLHLKEDSFCNTLRNRVLIR